MNIQERIAQLTEICRELRQSFRVTADPEQREKFIFKHIEAFADRSAPVNDFQAGLEWFNVDERLSITRHLTGKIVIFDFFTYCCINCMHILPDLAALEKKFSIEDGLVVIGVHSAKFSNERDSRRLAAAVQRYGITHPVVNDASLSMWRDLGVVCWPTLIMIGPEGQPLAVFVGEGHREELFLYVKVALNYFESLKRISHKQLPGCGKSQHVPATASSASALRFPGKLEIFHREEGEERLAISDSGNNRIIIMSLDGCAEHVIGGSDPGFRDGDFETAKFNAPQGLCISENAIYVADNENHAIRKIDLEKRLVTTIAGTGVQGQDYAGGKIGTEQPLSSPWDVDVYHHESAGKVVRVLLIAAAGTHQIWAYFFQDTIWWKNKVYTAGTCAAIVGTGREENRNNAYPHAAGLAQPSGLVVASENKIAYIADSESSAVRQIDLQTGRVAAVCGGNQNPADLHDYGDEDGVRYTAKLQHPLGVTWHPSEKVVYVADTYNHKIKRIHQNGRCETFCGAGSPDRSFTFDEPGGLALASQGQLLLVADTNNHMIKAIDLNNGNTITTLNINLSFDRSSKTESAHRFETTLSTDEAELGIRFSVVFKNELKLNEDAPQRWSLDLPPSWKPEAMVGDLASKIRLRLPPGDARQQFCITFNLIACTTDKCIPRKVFVVYNVRRSPNGLTIVTENHEIVLH